MSFLRRLGSSLSERVSTARQSNRKRTALSKSGLVALSARLLALNPHANLQRAAATLDDFFRDRHLVVDVGGGLATHDEIVNKVQFVDNATLDSVFAICCSISKWLEADVQNVAVLCCSAELARTVAACCFCLLGVAESAQQGLTLYAQATRSSWMDVLSKRDSTGLKFVASEKRFVEDFFQIKQHIQPGKKLANVLLRLDRLELVHLPALDVENGCRLMITITMGLQIVFSTMQHNPGGIQWHMPIADLPTTVPINKDVRGQGRIRVYHLPPSMNVSNPRVTLADLRFHTDVAAIKGANRLVFDCADFDKLVVTLVFSEPSREADEPADIVIQSDHDQDKHNQPDVPIVQPESVAQSEPEPEPSPTVDHVFDDEAFARSLQNEFNLEDAEIASVETLVARQQQATSSQSRPVPQSPTAITIAETTPPPSHSTPSSLTSRLSLAVSAAQRELQETAHMLDGQQFVAPHEDVSPTPAQLQQHHRLVDAERRDEIVARMMQAQYDQEILRQRHRGGGASFSEISTMPSFTCTADSKFCVSGQECAVCREPFRAGDRLRMLPCVHAFHAECVDQWLGQSKLCPVCQTDITHQPMVYR